MNDAQTNEEPDPGIEAVPCDSGDLPADEQTASTEDAFAQKRGEIYEGLRRRGADPHKADDLTQDAMLNSWSKQGLGVSLVYMWTAAKNRFIGGNRKPKSAPARDEAEAIKNQIREAKSDLMRNIVARERIRLILEAVKQMPPIYQKIFLLKIESGLNFEEIAAEVGLNEQQVKYRWYKTQRELPGGPDEETDE